MQSCVYTYITYIYLPMHASDRAAERSENLHSPGDDIEITIHSHKYSWRRCIGQRPQRAAAAAVSYFRRAVVSRNALSFVLARPSERLSAAMWVQALDGIPREREESLGRELIRFENRARVESAVDLIFVERNRAFLGSERRVAAKWIKER